MTSLYSICIAHEQTAQQIKQLLAKTFPTYYEVYLFNEKNKEANSSIKHRVQTTKQWIAQAKQNASFGLATIIIGQMLPDEVRDLSSDAHDLIVRVCVVKSNHESDYSKELHMAKRGITLKVDGTALTQEELEDKLIAWIKKQESVFLQDELLGL